MIVPTYNRVLCVSIYIYTYARRGLSASFVPYWNVCVPLSLRRYLSDEVQQIASVEEASVHVTATVSKACHQRGQKSVCNKYNCKFEMKTVFFSGQREFE